MIDLEITTEFAAGFRPTNVQIDYAREYMEESGLGSLIVAMDFPGKTHGIWEDGQGREAVMDGGAPAIWVDRDSALAALEAGRAGNALFRVYSDGHIHLVDEA